MSAAIIQHDRNFMS